MRLRHVLSALASAGLVLGVVALPGPASAANTDVVINEVESQDGFPDDWIELYNTGTAAVDISGWVVKDSTNNVRGTVAAATSLAPGGYYTVDGSSFGDVDQARLFLPDGTSQVGSTYSWTTPAHGTYSRCPNGTGPFVDATPSKNAANVCDTRTTWPGGAGVTVADNANTFTLLGNTGDDVSGLAYQGGVLWAVQNTAGTLYKLAKSGSLWTLDTAYGSGGAKALHYPDGTGLPDTEGLTLTDAGTAGGFFVSTERNAANSSVSRPSILQYQDSAATSLNATHEWNLAADLGKDIPTLAPNQALEGITWVPDSYLTAKGLVDQSTGAAYSPSTYPTHGSGLFLVGVEQTGTVYAYALDLTSNSYTRVAKFASGFPNVMDLTWEPEAQRLWVVCDDTCGGRTATFQVSGGVFAPTASYERPATSANLNNEGFAIAPQSECVNGLKPTFYADDSNDDGHVIRVGTLSCTPPATTPPVTPPTTPPTTQPAPDRTAPLVTIGGIKAGKTYPKRKKPTCVATDAGSGVATCTVTQKKKGKARAGVQKYVVTATAVDTAGNRASTTVKYKVRKRARAR